MAGNINQLERNMILRVVISSDRCYFCVSALLELPTDSYNSGAVMPLPSWDQQYARVGALYIRCNVSTYSVLLLIIIM